uniref:NADH dehydrogenase (Ubiquinone) 1 beta subcomplex 8 n=1 Tax=Schistosoma japonicum TaxID=6182 RepID=C1L9E4_SCHJA|nr:NADH dehydrogenase (ubiquinone) 1 beta subcomplex 8 [Schistosoma japonicum]
MTNLVFKRCRSILTPLCRGMAHYHIEWKPKPYPCTKAEREAAAKRYNLLPSDYKPFEGDGLAPGDYFCVEPYNVNNCDPWEPYDFPLERRNFSEPVQFNAHMYSAAGCDPEYSKRYQRGTSVWWVLLKIFAPLFVIGGLLYVGQMYCYILPLKAKQYPYATDNNMHYTFERAE